MDGSRFWWTGMHKAKNSDSFVWNSTNQEQALVNSWEGGKPAEIEIEAESCVGVSSSGSLRAEDCTAKHSAICQFGRRCNYVHFPLHLFPTQACVVRAECLPRQSSAGVALCTPRVRMTPCVWRGSVYPGVTLWTWCRRLTAGART